MGLVGHLPELARLMEDDSTGGGPGDFQKALQRLVEGLVAEFEGRMVHGEDVLGLGVSGHFPDLLGVGVGVDPGVVGTDAEDGEVDAAESVADAFEGLGVGGVSGVEDAVVGGLEEVTVEAPMAIPHGSGAPMVGAEGADLEAVEVEFVVPVEFDFFAEALWDEAFGVLGGDDFGVLSDELSEAGLVEVIEVGVRDEDEVNGWEFVGREVWIAEAFHADGVGPKVDADAFGKDGIGEDPEVVEAEKDGGVSEPGGGEGMLQVVVDRTGGIDGFGSLRPGGRIAERLHQFGGIAPGGGARDVGGAAEFARRRSGCSRRGLWAGWSVGHGRGVGRCDQAESGWRGRVLKRGQHRRLYRLQATSRLASADGLGVLGGIHVHTLRA